MIAVLFNVSGTESSCETTSTPTGSFATRVSSTSSPAPLGGSPAYHALSLTSLAAGPHERRRAGRRARGGARAARRRAFGAPVVELLPRMLVGGVLVFLGLALLVEWVWDRRRSLPRVEYVVVLLILATIVCARASSPG